MTMMSPTNEIRGVQHSFLVLQFVDWPIERKVLTVAELFRDPVANNGNKGYIYIYIEGDQKVQ
jgi:hypothetical protein